MHAPIPPRLDREEPELSMEDDIPSSAPDEVEHWDTAHEEGTPEPE